MFSFTSVRGNAIKYHVSSSLQVVCVSKKAGGRSGSRVAAEVVSTGPGPAQPGDGDGVSYPDEPFGPE